MICTIPQVIRNRCPFTTAGTISNRGGGVAITSCGCGRPNRGGGCCAWEIGRIVNHFRGATRHCLFAVYTSAIGGVCTFTRIFIRIKRGGGWSCGGGG